MVQESYAFSLFKLPPDAGWSDIEDTPEDLRRTLEIYDSAKRDDVEGSIVPIKKIDAFYDAFDGLEGQDVVVAKDASDSIVGVASLDTRRNPPFFIRRFGAPQPSQQWHCSPTYTTFIGKSD